MLLIINAFISKDNAQIEKLFLDLYIALSDMIMIKEAIVGEEV